MSEKVAIMLADGFEPVEVTAPIDCLRRAGIEVDSVSIMPGLNVESAQNIEYIADKLLDDVDLNDYDALIVPGGSVGVENLKKCRKLSEALGNFFNEDKVVASICAGPLVLNAFGLLEGRHATCYPGCEADFPSGVYVPLEDVVIDGNLITSKGPGTALDFGIEIVRKLADEDTAEEVARGMLVK